MSVSVCMHPKSTLVQHVDVIDYHLEEEPDASPIKVSFVCYQCDHCGLITKKEVTPKDLINSDSLPWLDEPSYLDGMEALHQPKEERAVNALRFMLRATRQ